MDIATKRPMTVDEFLAWDDEQEFWHEFDGENVLVVEACTFNHAVIASNLICMLGNQLKASPYQAIGGGFRLRAAAAAARHPDAQVYPMPMDGCLTISDQAVAVLEVLSPETARMDRHARAENDWATPAIKYYVLVEPECVGAVVLSRGPLAWKRTSVERDGVLDLPAIGVSLPLADLYRDVSFPADPSSDAAWRPGRSS